MVNIVSLENSIKLKKNVRTQLSMKFFMLINVMLTIISMIKVLKQDFFFISKCFNFYKELKFYARFR